MVTNRKQICVLCMKSSQNLFICMNKDCYYSSKKYIEILLFDFCYDCLLADMSSIPQGMFIAKKVRKNEMRLSKINNMESDQQPNFEGKYMELSPLKYNSKLMNSIWGLYNRYSVHNIKMNTDADKQAVFGEQQRPNVASPSADQKASIFMTIALKAMRPSSLGESY